MNHNNVRLVCQRDRCCFHVDAYPLHLCVANFSQKHNNKSSFQLKTSESYFITQTDTGTSCLHPVISFCWDGTSPGLILFLSDRITPKTPTLSMSRVIFRHQSSEVVPILLLRLISCDASFGKEQRRQSITKTMPEMQKYLVFLTHLSRFAHLN